MPAVALVVIAKNEERSIGRLLESAKNLVDEIVVLDTGSDDSTVAIALAAGAKVSYFSWVGNFSAARNRALDLTDAPWRLVLDADEWLAEDSCDIRTVCTQDPRFVGRIRIDSSFQRVISNERRTLTSCARISRLLPRGVNYAGAIHEQPIHSLPTKDIPIRVLHDGYEDKQLQTKGDRNISILETILKTGGDDVYYHYQYAKELIGRERHLDAVTHIEIALDAASPVVPWHLALVSVALQSYGRTAMFERALKLIDSQLPRYLNSTEFWFSVGTLYMNLAFARPKDAKHVLPLLERAFLQCIELGEHASDEGIVGRGSFLAAQNLYAFYSATKQTEKAEKFKALCNGNPDVPPDLVPVGSRD